MTKRTKRLETATRKKIDLMLKNLNWHENEELPDCNVFTERAKTTAQSEELKKLSGHIKPPDYVLYKYNTDTPIAIIEAKRSGENIEKALEQAITNYAIPLNVKIVFAYDSTFFKSWHVDHSRELRVDGESVTSLLSESKLLRFIEEGHTISEIKPNIKQSRSELISIFKSTNDLLRGEGLKAGTERFNEFANILFLKLISEMEAHRESQGESRIISEAFCWDKYSNKNADDLYFYINDTVLKELKNTYGAIFDERLKIKAHTLKIIVDKLSKIQLMNIDSDVKGDAFEYFLRDSVTVGNDLGEYFTPRHVVKLMVNLLDPKINEKIYDPTCGTGGFLISSFNYIKERTAMKGNTIKILKEKTIFGTEKTGTAKIAKMNMIITGDGHTNIQQRDSLDDVKNNVYDVVLANPPYGQSTPYGHHYPITSNSGDVIFIQHIVKSLIEGGRASVVIPEGVLFRPHDDYKLRKWLIQNTDIQAIISLPKGVFRPYANNKTNIIILEKNKSGTKSIWFYDLTADGFELDSDFRRPVDENDIPHLLSKWNEREESKKSWNVSRSMIEKCNYDLIPKTYMPIKNNKKNLVKLSNILRQVKEKVSIDDNRTYKQIKVKLNGNGAVLRTTIKGHRILTKNQFVAREHNLIISKIDANKGAMALVPKELDGAIVTSDFPLFEINTDKITLEYFDFCLRYGDHTNILTNRSRGTTNRQRIKIEDILNLSIHIPNELSEQERIVSQLKKQESLKLESKKLIIKLEEAGINNTLLKLSIKKSVSFTDVVSINPKYMINGNKNKYKILDMKGVDSYDGRIDKLTTKDDLKGTSKFQNGDIIFSKMTTGEKIKVAHIDYLGKSEIGLGSAEFVVLKPKKIVLSEWVFFFCKSNYVKKYVKENIRGTTRSRIPPNFFTSIMIPDISIEEQKDIVHDLKKYTNSKKPLEELIEISDKAIRETIKTLFVS